MKFTINSSELTKALEQAAKFVSTKPLMPILANIKLVATDDKLTLTGFDLAHGIEVDCTADVLELGSVCIPASTIAIIKGIAGQLIIETNENNLITISNLSGRVEIQGQSTEEYPELITDESESKTTHSIESTFLTQAVKYCAQSASTDESKAILTGINLTADSGNLRAMATDGHRLTIFNMPVKDNVILDSVTIPVKSLGLVPVNKSGDNNILLSIDNNQVSIDSGSRSIMRTLDGKYPDAMMLVPKSFTRYIDVDRRQLIDALNMMSAISDQNNLVKFVLESDKLIISSSSDGKSGKVEIDCKMTGTDFEQFEELSGQLFVVAFNLKYLLDGLKMFDSKLIKLSMNEPLQPVIITSDVPSDVNLLYLIMPVQIRS